MEPAGEPFKFPIPSLMDVETRQRNGAIAAEKAAASMVMVAPTIQSGPPPPPPPFQQPSQATASASALPTHSISLLPPPPAPGDDDNMMMATEEEEAEAEAEEAEAEDEDDDDDEEQPSPSPPQKAKNKKNKNKHKKSPFAGMRGVIDMNKMLIVQPGIPWTKERLEESNAEFYRAHTIRSVTQSEARWERCQQGKKCNCPPDARNAGKHIKKNPNAFRCKNFPGPSRNFYVYQDKGMYNGHNVRVLVRDTGSDAEQFARNQGNHGDTHLNWRTNRMCYSRLVIDVDVNKELVNFSDQVREQDLRDKRFCVDQFGKISIGILIDILREVATCVLPDGTATSEPLRQLKREDFLMEWTPSKKSKVSLHLYAPVELGLQTDQIRTMFQSDEFTRVMTTTHAGRELAKMIKGRLPTIRTKVFDQGPLNGSMFRMLGHTKNLLDNPQEPPQFFQFVAGRSEAEKVGRSVANTWAALPDLRHLKSIIVCKPDKIGVLWSPPSEAAATDDDDDDDDDNDDDDVMMADTVEALLPTREPVSSHERTYVAEAEKQAQEWLLGLLPVQLRLVDEAQATDLYLRELLSATGPNKRKKHLVVNIRKKSKKSKKQPQNGDSGGGGGGDQANHEEEEGEEPLLEEEYDETAARSKFLRMLPIQVTEPIARQLCSKGGPFASRNMMTPEDEAFNKPAYDRILDRAEASLGAGIVLCPRCFARKGNSYHPIKHGHYFVLDNGLWVGCADAAEMRPNSLHWSKSRNEITRHDYLNRLRPSSLPRWPGFKDGIELHEADKLFSSENRIPIPLWPTGEDDPCVLAILLEQLRIHLAVNKNKLVQDSFGLFWDLRTGSIAVAAKSASITEGNQIGSGWELKPAKCLDTLLSQAFVFVTQHKLKVAPFLQVQQILERLSRVLSPTAPSKCLDPNLRPPPVCEIAFHPLVDPCTGQVLNARGDVVVATEDAYRTTTGEVPCCWQQPPSLENIRETVMKFRDVIHGCNLVGGEEHKDNVAVYVLSLAMAVQGRHLVSSTLPITLCKGSAPKAGKTVFAEQCSFICCGGLPSRSTFPESDEKKNELVASLRSAPLCVLFDNVKDRSVLDSPFLEAYTTSPGSIGYRAFFTQDETKLPTNKALFITANDLDIKTAAMLRRVFEVHFGATSTFAKTKQQHICQVKELRDPLAIIFACWLSELVRMPPEERQTLLPRYDICTMFDVGCDSNSISYDIVRAFLVHKLSTELKLDWCRGDPCTNQKENFEEALTVKDPLAQALAQFVQTLITVSIELNKGYGQVGQNSNNSYNSRVEALKTCDNLLQSSTYYFSLSELFSKVRELALGLERICYDRFSGFANDLRTSCTQLLSSSSTSSSFNHRPASGSSSSSSNDVVTRFFASPTLTEVQLRATYFSNIVSQKEATLTAPSLKNPAGQQNSTYRIKIEKKTKSNTKHYRFLLQETAAAGDGDIEM